VVSRGAKVLLGLAGVGIAVGGVALLASKASAAAPTGGGGTPDDDGTGHAANAKPMAGAGWSKMVADDKAKWLKNPSDPSVPEFLRKDFEKEAQQHADDPVQDILGNPTGVPSKPVPTPPALPESVNVRKQRIADAAVKEVRDAWAGKPAMTPAHAVARQDPTKPVTAAHGAAAPKPVVTKHKVAPTHPNTSQGNTRKVLQQHGVADGRATNDQGAAVLQAARDLVAYVQAGGRDRMTVSQWQRVLGLDPDGIMGGVTERRAETVLAKPITWPKDLTPAGAAPVPANATEAANDLHAYVTVFGGTRKSRIEVYQRAMGVDLSAGGAGNVGPKTKAKYAALTGKEW
jgi:hypothetical protein